MPLRSLRSGEMKEVGVGIFLGRVALRLIWIFMMLLRHIANEGVIFYWLISA